MTCSLDYAKFYSFYIICCLLLWGGHAYSQWNPHAGVVPSFAAGATVITSSGGNGALAIDGNNNTAWQSGGGNPVLPVGYISRPDLNILLGLGATAQYSSSGTVAAAKTTDGDLNTAAPVNLSSGSAWVRYSFAAPVSLRTLTVKCGLTASVNIIAYHQNGDSTLIGTLVAPADNFAIKKFTPLLSNVTALRMVSAAQLSVFEVAAMSGYPTEYLIVDLGQTRQVGFIETRHWSDGNARSTAIYLSNDFINWTLAGSTNPDALLSIITRPPTPVNARYVKIEHTLHEVDYAKGYVWEVKIYDKNGPFGPFPAARPHTSSVRDILGINGIWGWGHNMFTNSIPLGQGASRFNQIATHARNYHNMHWDVDDPDDIPDYANMPFGLAVWWLDWDREYLAWNNYGLKVQASIQFNEWIPQTRMIKWDDPYGAAYNYGYAFARHFGPTYGNGLVEIMEIGNEPWTYPASFYLTVFEGMLRGAKDADPNMKVLPCALQSHDPGAENAVGGNYMGARLTPALAAMVDGINVHHYSYTTDQNGTRIAVHPEHPESEMRHIVNDIRFRDANMPGKKIYLSEWGWDSEGAGEGCTFGECVSEYEQAVYAVRGAMMFMRLGIDRITWYFYGNQASGNIYSRSGLEGNPPDHLEKRAYKSFRSFVHLLGDKRFLDVLHEDETAWIYLFGDASNHPTHLVAWRPIEGDDLSTLQYNLPTSLLPDSAWIISGLNYTGEAAPLPPYQSGTMQLTLRSAPLVVKVTVPPATVYTWSGHSSDEWNNPLNWYNYSVPGPGAQVIIPGGRPHYPAAYTAPVEVGRLVLESGSQMTLVPGSNLTVTDSLILNGGTLITASVGGLSPELHIKGHFVQKSGAFQPGTSKVVINGSGNQTISGTLRFHHLMVESGSSLELSGPVTVSGIISVMTGATLYTNGLLTIESGGSLMHGLNTPGGQEGAVIGDIAIRRQGSTSPHKYNFWSSPVQQAQVSILGSTPYYYHPSQAQDTSEQGMRTGWMPASGLMQPGKGYISQGSGLVTFSGTPNNASVAAPIAIPVSKNVGVQNNVPYNLVGNPFPSALDGKKFLDVNGPSGRGIITGALYFWDDDGSGGGGWNTAQDYAVWNGAGLVAGYNSGTLFKGFIASGQSFFVEKIADGTHTVLFDNSMRATDNQAFFRQSAINRFWISLTDADSNYNETLIAFLPDASDSVDLQYDAKKLVGNAALAFYSRLLGRNYAIQSLGTLRETKSIPLGYRTAMGGILTLSLKNLEGLDETVVIILEDRLTSTFTNLRLHNAYTFTTAAGTYDQRFVLHIYPPLQVNTFPEDCEGNPGHIMVSAPGSYVWTYAVRDSLGSTLYSGNALASLNMFALSAGRYSLGLTDAFNYTLTKQVQVPGMKKVNAGFLHNYQNREIYPHTQIRFTDITSGASFNTWDFGDGQYVANSPQPVHAYSDTGTYEVVLQAWNDECADTCMASVTVKENKNAPFPPAFVTASGGLEQAYGVKVWPYGGSLIIKFLFEDAEPSEVILTDITGRELITATLSTGGTHRLEVSGLSPALYIVKISSPVKTFAYRLFFDGR